MLTLIYKIKFLYHIIFVSVIAWARGQLRVNFTSIYYQGFHKLREFWKYSFYLSLAAREHLRWLVYQWREKFCIKDNHFKVLPSSKLVCRLSSNNSPVVARGKPAIIVSRSEHTNFNSLKAISPHAKFYAIPLFAKLAPAWSSIDERRKEISKRALATSWIQNSPYPCENITQNLGSVFAVKVACDTIKAYPKQNEEINF